MPVQSDISPSAYIYNIQHTVQNASQITLTVNPAGTATVQDIMDIETPEFDDSGTVEGISSFPSFLETMKSKMNFFQFFRNLKAGLQFVLHAGQIVNNCVTDNAGLPLSAAQGKILKDLYTQLYSDLNTTNNNLSKAKYTNDLFYDRNEPAFVSWNGDTLNTPLKAGLTDCQEGFAFCYGNWNSYMTVIAFAKNSNKMWIYSKLTQEWTEYVTKNDLNARFMDMSDFTIEKIKSVYGTNIPIVGYINYTSAIAPDRNTGFVLAAAHCAIFISFAGSIYGLTSGNNWEKKN